MPCTTKDAHDLQASLGRRDLDPGLRGVDDGRPASTVEHLDPHEHVGDGALQSGKFDSLARKSAGAGLDRVAGQHRVSQFLGRRLLQVSYVVGS